MAEFIPIKETDFYCDEDLSKYTDSLLFDSQTDIAGLKMYDANDNCVDLWLTVRGEKDVFLLDVNGDIIEDECYKYASEYSQKMIDAIKNGTDGIDYACNNNNWFEVLYSYGDVDGGSFDDGEVWDGIADTTPEQLKDDLSEFALTLFEQYYDRGIFERPQLDYVAMTDEIKTALSHSFETLGEGAVLTLTDFPKKDYRTDLEMNSDKSCTIYISNKTYSNKFNCQSAELSFDDLQGELQKIKDLDTAYINKTYEQIDTTVLSEMKSTKTNEMER